MSEKFTHLKPNGEPNMVDVGAKFESKREAIAQAVVYLNEEVFELLQNDDIQTKKGAVFQTAILAGIMGAKQTASLIPLCHPLGLDTCNIEMKPQKNHSLLIVCTCKVSAKTGVEMEALTGATVAALTVYDMCKGISKGIEISDVKLIKKTGGKSDYERTS